MSKNLFLIITALLVCFSTTFAQTTESSTEHPQATPKTNNQLALSQKSSSQEKENRIGGDREIEAETPSGQQSSKDELPRFEVGVNYTNYVRENISGVGARFTVNLNRYAAVEAEVDYFPKQTDVGENTLGLFGIKAGKRWGKFGVFGKARPGFEHRTFGILRYDRNPNASPTAPFVEAYSPETVFALDIGAVIEYYPTKRIITRVDLGDTLLFLPARTVNVPTFANPAVLAPVRFNRGVGSAVQFSVGIGYRF